MIVKGDRAVWPAVGEPELFIEVRRVARDRSWADIAVCNAYAMWTKRQPLDQGDLVDCRLYRWTQDDLDGWLERWEAKRS